MKKLLSLVIAFIVITSVFAIPVYAEGELFSKETLEYYNEISKNEKTDIGITIY